jgi:hypothetical protein
MAMTATSLYIPTISDHLDAHRNLTNNPEHVPDIVEFVTSPHFLNRPNLYPRQATWLKVIFLELEMLTDYDYQVIGEWSEGFKLPERPPAHLDPESDAVLKYSGDWGIVPDVIERMKILRSMNYRWFRQVLAVLGRRSAKGYIGGLAGSYVLWYYLMLGDARDHFGIDRDKRLACQVFAGKKMQARDNQWRDIVNVIAGAPCFQKYISQSLAESISVNSKVDLVRPPRDTTMDLATYEIVPKEATTMAARGPASFMQFYDEMAHMVSTTGGSRSAEEVYDSATPSLDQFKNLAFIYSGSSPWQMTGKFYELVSQTLQVDADTLRPVYPENIMLQLESWNIYEDWADTADGKFVARPKCTKIIPFEGPKEFPEITFKPLKNAIQEYDERMQRLERANPDTFRVERRCLDPDTRVLTADLTWVRIDDLVAGDRLVAVDEHPPGDGTQRRMRTAEVVAKWDSVSDAYRITFDDGSSIVCSGTHRWLSTTPSDPGSYRWRSLYRPEGTPGPRRSIKVGDSIAFMVDPWEEDSSREAGYLAGVYDGEGTAIGYPRREFRVSFVQNPGEVLDATLGYLRDKGFTPRYMPVEGKRAQTHVIQGLPEVLRFVGQIGGHKIRRQAIPAMWEGRGLGRVNGRSGCKVVASIEPLGERRLVDIETTTGTFIAEGLISHNSKWATVMDAYFPEAHVRRMFDPWTQFPAEEAPQRLAMKQKGSPTIDYVAHADPGKTGSNFGFAIGHKVMVPGQSLPHVVFDVIKAWQPQDFDSGEMDYEVIEAEMKEYVDNFMPTQLTFDQWNSIGFIQRIGAHSRKNNFKVTRTFERTATGPINWKTAETMKVALSLNLIHCPIYDLLELECLFLRKLPGDKVDHPDSGPVTTKDVYDAVSIVIHELIGADVAAYLGEQLSDLKAVTGLPGPKSPERAEDVRNQFSQFTAERREALRYGNPARPIPTRGRAPQRRR